MKVHVVLRVTLLALLFLKGAALSAPEPVKEESQPKRTCFGLIWCREEKDDTVSTDAFFYLYSSEYSSTSSKLAIRPFYLYEADPKENHIRRSILWPLGTYERKTDYLWFHVFPFYWHTIEPNRKFTLVPPLYLNYLRDDRSYRYFFPFYAHHARGGYYDRHFILGPLLIATRDTKNEFRQLDIVFPFFHNSQYKDHGHAWLIPFYFSGYNNQETSSFRYILPLYGKRVTQSAVHQFFVPLFGSEQLKEQNESRFSMFGLPPISALRPLPTLSLYEHRSGPEMTTDRFFPVYRYASMFHEENRLNVLLLYNHNNGVKRLSHVTDSLFPVWYYNNDSQHRNLQFSLFGYNKISLFWSDHDKELTENHIFPLYSYTNDHGMGEFQFTFAGHGDFGLYTHQRYQADIYDRLFPLYDYSAQDTVRSFSLFGLSELALFRYKSAPESTRNRLFPLYGYNYYPDNNEREFGVLGYPPLSFYYHKENPLFAADRLFPLYGYRNVKGEGTGFTMLGLPPSSLPVTLALFEHSATPHETRDRLFPLYTRYHNLVTGELRWDSLFIYQHRQTFAYFKDTFLPIHYYEKDIANERRQFSLIGVPPFTMFDYLRSPMRTTSYLFPFYWYGNETETDVRTLGILGFGGLSLYRHQAAPYGKYDYLFPLYGYRKDDMESRFTVLGFPPPGGSLPALSLYEHHVSRDRFSDRFFPLYSVSRNNNPKSSNLNVLLLYNHITAEGELNDFLLPLYSYDKSEARTGFSMIGFQDFALYQYIKTPSVRLSRLFPVYAYRRETPDNETFLNVLLLYWHKSMTDAAKDVLFPLYDYSRDKAAKAFSLVGYSEISLFRYRTNPDSTHNRLFPLYSYVYKQEKKESRFSFLGLPQIGDFPALAVYEHAVSPVLTYDRFFPLYRYAVYRDKQEKRFEIAFLFREINNPVLKRNIFFPLYSYENNAQSGERRFGLLGLAPVSLYQHLAQKDMVFDRFFPVYNFSSDHQSGKSELSVIWPLFDLKIAGGKTTETSIFWWLLRYTRPDDSHMTFRVLGGSAMAVLRRDVTPERSFFEFNPVIPFYSYEKETGKGTRWDFLGGLLGMRTDGGSTKTRIFWVYF